jgi:tRNA 2-thiouridine synthesizing protein A
MQEPPRLLAKAVRSAGPGETRVVQADDRAFPADVEAWCRKTGNQLVSLCDKGRYFEAIVRRV